MSDPTDAELEAKAEADASSIRRIGLATEVMNTATSVLNFATTALRAGFNETQAENIYQQQRLNLREQQGLATADAFARATVRTARNLVQNARSTEEIAAGQRMLQNLQRDLKDREDAQKKAEAAAAKKRKAMVGYAVAGAAVLALVVTVVVMSRKPAPQEPRASGSTRPRRRR